MDDDQAREQLRKIREGRNLQWARRQVPPRRMLVGTANSLYLFDEAEMFMIRVTREESSGQLRRDGERVPLLQWPQPVLGQSMQLLLADVSDSPNVVMTMRVTSAVVEVSSEREMGEWLDGLPPACP